MINKRDSSAVLSIKPICITARRGQEEGHRKVNRRRTPFASSSVAGHHHSVSNANATEAAATRCKVQEGEEQVQEYINPFIGLTLFVINIIIIFILNECNESLCRVSFWWWTRWRGSSGELLGIDQSDHIPQHCVPSTLHWLHSLCHSILLLKMVSMEKQINQIYTFSIFPFLYVNKF